MDRVVKLINSIYSIYESKLMDKKEKVLTDTMVIPHRKS